MGSTMSSSSGPTSGPVRPKLEDVPESCIALVLGHLEPPEICRLAGLNRAFRGASSADFIWVEKLPSNYHFILQKLLESSNDDDDHDHIRRRDFEGFTKKDIFARLSRPNTFDCGNKAFVSEMSQVRISASPILSYCARKYGWIKILVVYACQFHPRPCQLLELRIDGIGITFPLRNLDSGQWHTLYKYGGLKFVGSWTSNSQQEHTASSSESNLVGPRRDLAVGFVMSSISMAGTLDP